jgi:GGDEF domain-containing protein
VLTLYSTKELAFLEDHGRIVGAVAPQVAKGMASTNDRELSAPTRSFVVDPPTLLASVQHAFLTLTNSSTEIALLLIQIEGLFEAGSRSYDTANRAMEVVKDSVRRTLRSGDSVFEFGLGRLVVLLPHAVADDALAFARRVQQVMDATELLVPTPQRIRLRFGAATSPRDGEDLPSLIECARLRVVAENRGERPPSVH